MELKDSEIEYIDKIIDLAKKNPDKIKLLPKSKLMYINKTYDNFKKVMSLKVFLESLIENVE